MNASFAAGSLFGDPALWLGFLVNLWLKGLFILAATGLVVAALRRSAAAVRSLLWGAALSSLLAIPALSVLMPGWEVGLLPHIGAGAVAAAGTPAAVALPALPRPERSASPSLSGQPARMAPMPEPAPAAVPPGVAVTVPPGSQMPWTFWALLAWAGGVLIVLTRLLVAHAGVRLLVRQATPIDDVAWQQMAARTARRMGVTQAVRLRWSRWTSVPMTAGLFRPVILLPPAAEAWDADHREIVLLHELAHIRRRDCLVQALTTVACAFNWVNPLVWVAARQLRIERERACDDLVLMAGTQASAYAETLLRTAQTPGRTTWSSAAALAMARRSQLEGRLLSILDAGLRRRLDRAEQVLAGLIVAGFVLPLATLQPATGARAQAPSVLAGPVPAQTPAPPPSSVPPPAPPPAVPALALRAPAVADTLTIEELIRLRRYGVDAEFIRALREAGYADLTLDELVDLARYGADASFVRTMNEAWSERLTVEQLTDLARYGVDPDFMRELREAGYTDLTISLMVDFARYGVDGAYVRAMREAGYTNLSAEGLTDLSKYGVDPDFIRELREAGYANLSVEELVDLAKYGVDGTYIRAMTALDLEPLSLGELADLARYGVDAAYVQEIRDAGLRDFTIEQLIDLRKHGVDGAYIREMQGQR